MKLKTEPASVSQALRYIAAKGWTVDNGEVYFINEQGQKDYLPVKQFCRKFAEPIKAFIARTKPVRKMIAKARLAEKAKGRQLPEILLEKV